MTDVLTPENREKLFRVSVATISTCMYRAGVRNVCPDGIVPVAPGLPRMVGEAYTLRFVPMREDKGDPVGPVAGGNIHQRAFEECPQDAVLVMDTRGETRGCSCGDLLIGRLKARGCAGIVTDGGFRDTPDVAALGFPAYQARAVPAPSFLRLHAIELNVPVGCTDVAVYPRDIVVGDAEGVVIVPAALANRIAEDAYEQSRYDAFATEEIARGRSIIGLYPPTEASRAEYRSWLAQWDD